MNHATSTAPTKSPGRAGGFPPPPPPFQRENSKIRTTGEDVTMNSLGPVRVTCPVTNRPAAGLFPSSFVCQELLKLSSFLLR